MYCMCAGGECVCKRVVWQGKEGLQKDTREAKQHPWALSSLSVCGTSPPTLSLYIPSAFLLGNLREHSIPASLPDVV